MLIFSKRLLFSAFRDLFNRKTRSLAVIIVMAATTAFPIAFLSTSPSLDVSFQDESGKYAMCHLDIRFLHTPLNVTAIVRNIIDDNSVVEGRIVSLGRSKSQDIWYPTYIIGIDPASPPTHAPHLNQIRLKAGRMIEDPQTEILVLESYAQFIQKKIGDNIRIGGITGEYDLTIVGLVSSIEFMSFNLGREAGVFVSNDIAGELAGLPPGDINSVLVHFKESITVEEIKLVDKKLRVGLLIQNNPPILIWHVRETSVRNSLHRAITLTSQYLAVSSILTFLVCGIVVLIVMNRYIAEQSKLIGVYTAFGFNKTEIVANYLVRVVILGVIGSVLGILGSRGILEFLVNEIASGWGIETRKVQIDPILFFLTLLVAWIIIILFAAIPAWKITQLTPYEAVRGFDKGKKARKGPLDVLLFSHKLPSLPRLAIRNIGRNRVRSWLTILAILLSLSLSSSLLATSNSVKENVRDHYQNHIQWNIQATFYEPVNESIITTIYNDSQIKQIEKEYNFFTQPAEDVSRILIGRAIEIPSSLEIFELDSGELITNNSASECLISANPAHEMKLKVGDTITLLLPRTNLTLTIRGMIIDFDQTVGVIFPHQVLKQHFLDYYPEITSYYNSIMIATREEDEKAIIQDLFNNPTIQQVRTWADSLNRMIRWINTAVIVAYLMMLLGFLVAFIALFNTFFISTVEREREFAIMKAFGYSGWALFRSLLYEACIVVPIGSILGLIGSYPLALYFLNLVSFYFFEMDYYLLMSTIAVSILFALLATVTSIFPGFYVVSKKPIATTILEE
ncbi:MAG: FtsX-like permease family protein [Candidatus Hodarchaeota archaeon]